MTKLKGFVLIIAVISSILIILAGCSPTPYQLSTSVVPLGGGTISPSNGTFNGGSQVVLIANPSQNYKFAGWAGEASGNTNPLTVNMNANKQIVAQFSKVNFSVQANSSPSEGGTIYPPSGSFESGTQVTFTAKPNNGYRFEHWSDDINGNSVNSTLLINTNKIVTAHFIKVYNLTITTPSDVGATVSPKSGIYDAGSNVTLSTKATLCPYAFDHWNGTNNDNANPTIITMSSDKSVTVYFKEFTKGSVVKDSQNIWGGGVISIPFELNQFEWVQGEIWGPSVAATIRDTNGIIVKDLGIVTDANFTFNAETTGHYTFVLYNTNVISASSYNLNYTIYHR